MNRRTLTAVLAAVAAAWSIAASPALAAATSAPADATLQVIDVDASAYPDVEVRVIAPRPLVDDELDGGAFTVVEGGETREVEASRVTGVDLEAVLVIDTSGSMSGAPLDAAKRAAVEFIRTMPDDAEIALVAFSSAPTIVSGFTSDEAALTAAIGKLSVGGGTALYDAGAAAAALFRDRSESVRSVVLLSDGGDSRSAITADAAARQLRAADAVVHAVELTSPESSSDGLAHISAVTAGHVVRADDPAALAGLYGDVAADVANQYLLHYRSGTFGPVDLEVGVDARGVRSATAHVVEMPEPTGLAAFLVGPGGLMLGAAACYAALGIVVVLLIAPSRPRTRLAGRGQFEGSRLGAVSDVADWATALAERGLRRRGRTASLNRALEQAGINLRSGEFLVLVVCGAAGAGATGIVLGGTALGLVFGAAVIVAAKVVLSWRRTRRQSRFAEQLGDTLQLLSGSLRAGYSLLQAVDAVGREAESPTAEEFRRVVVETRLGRGLTQSFEAMADRVGGEDFAWVVQAVAIQREVGGDLADVLDRVAHTIRERDKVRRQVKALSAEGRMSAWVLLALPVVITGFLFLSTPDYIGELFESLVGWVMVVTACVLMTVGALWLRKLVRVQF